MIILRTLLLLQFAVSIFGQEHNTEDDEVTEEILELSFEPDGQGVEIVLPTNRPWIVGHRGASGMVRSRFFPLLALQHLFLPFAIDFVL